MTNPNTVLVALSGGIDSAATALLLREEGYEVHGVTFDLTGETDSVDAAHHLAEKISIPCDTVDLREKFQKEIVSYFADSYLRGETPAPCTVCNPVIKWQTLIEIADRRNIGRIATGHYVRIVNQDGIYFIAKGIDPVKDQSYYLWDLPQKILSRVLTPLGKLTKHQTREFMETGGFPALVQKKESMGVCFLDREGPAGLLRHRVRDIDRFDGGEVTDRKGNVIGTHSGYMFYTVGQKRGFDLFIPDDLYIISIDPLANRLVVGPKSDLYATRLMVERVRLNHPAEFFTLTDISVRIRGLGLNPEGFCQVEKPARHPLFSLLSNSDRLSLESIPAPPDHHLIITVPERAYAPAKGQPLVFYHGDRVLGGGYLSAYE